MILALGDSLTAGHGLARHESFAARLEDRLRLALPKAQVVNAGVSGATSAGALQRLPRVLAGLRQRPDLALVELGANDLLRGVPPTEVRSSLSAIVEELACCGIPAMLATMEPPAFLAQFVSGYSTIYAEVASRFGIPTCPFFPPGVLGHPRMVLADRLHPNARAVDLCAEGVAARMLDLLGEMDLRAA